MPLIKASRPCTTAGGGILGWLASFIEIPPTAAAGGAALVPRGTDSGRLRIKWRWDKARAAPGAERGHERASGCLHPRSRLATSRPRSARCARWLKATVVDLDVAADAMTRRLRTPGRWSALTGMEVTSCCLCRTAGVE